MKRHRRLRVQEPRGIPEWIKRRRPWVPAQERLAKLRARFMRLVTWDGNSTCWLWCGYVCKSGYGRWWRGTEVSALAHRGAFELFRAPLLPGLELDHVCRVRMCVNPWHLQPVSPLEHRQRTTDLIRSRRLLLVWKRPPREGAGPERLARGRDG